MGQLRVTQLWNGEVMDERAPETGMASIGSDKGAMFVIPPNLGVPTLFPMFVATEAGLVINLHEGMSGRLQLGGVTQRVEDVLGQGTIQRSVILRPRDWGLVELGGGEHGFFFQYGAPPAPVETGIGAELPLVAPAFAISAFIHLVAFILVILFWVPPEDKDKKLVLARLLDPPAAPPAVEIPPELKLDEVKSGIDEGEKDAPAASTAGEAGKAGGAGDRPRARDPEPLGKGDPTVTKVLNTGILKHRDKLAQFGERNALDDRLNNALSRLRGPRTEGGLGYGTGTGTGVGPGRNGTGTLTRGTGTGPGGGGTAHQDIVTAEAIKTGGVRAPKGVPGGGGVAEAKVKVDVGTPDGDFGDLTPEQIQKVVLAHRGAIQYCFEKELQRVPGLSGKIVLTWRIDGSGKVTSSKVKSTTMGNANVEDCLARQVRGWKFPAPSGGNQAVVNYPFLFARR
jgi:hypothetical protein